MDGDALKATLALLSDRRPRSVNEITAALSHKYSNDHEANRRRLQRLVFRGLVRRQGYYPVLYTLVANEPTSDIEHIAVDIPRLGHDGITDPDVLDEIEAAKVWTCAAVLRAANTSWGIDMGIDADVREARALMAEARRQVREQSPVGEHYREEPLSFSEARGAAE